MKKSLLAIAAMTAFAGAAQAQSSVTVYGVMDAGIASITNGTGSSTSANNKTTGLQDGGLSSPRLGFMGTEDLGGGMAAKFLLESELSLRTGGDNGLSTNGAAPTSPAIFSRGAWVGLSDKTLGETRLGFQNTITYDNSVEFDALKAANMGGFATVGGSSKGAGVAGPGTGNIYKNYMATRVNSSYAYLTPVFNGFSAKVVQGQTQALGPLEGNSASTRLTEYGVRYEGYNAKVAINAGSLAGAAGSDATQGGTSAGTRVQAAYGAYDFKVAEVTAARVVTTGQGTGGKDYITTGVGVRAPVTAKITLGATYTMVDNKAIATSGGSSVIGTVAEYAMSKRTTAYALAAFSNNQANSATSMTSTSKFSAATQVGANGLNQTGFMIGMRHSF
jgi:predicted porin